MPSTQLTTGAIAAETGAHIATVRRWIDSGRLPAYRVGNRWRVHREDLNAFLNAGQLPAGIDDYSDWLKQQLDQAPPISETQARRIARLIAKAAA
jgi:excisionase family DNA binding protein